MSGGAPYAGAALAQDPARGGSPSFDAYRAPTRHPLWVAISIPIAALGGGGDRVLLAICVLSLVALVAAVYELGRQVFGVLVGVVAAGLLASRLDFPFLAARGYIDRAAWLARRPPRTVRRGLVDFFMWGMHTSTRPGD